MNSRSKNSTPKLENSQLNCRGSKKNLATNRSRAERIDLLDWDHSEHSIVDQAKLLSLNRSGLYYKPVPPSPEEICLKHRIDELYIQGILSWAIARSRAS